MVIRSALGEGRSEPQSVGEARPRSIRRKPIQVLNYTPTAKSPNGWSAGNSKTCQGNSDCDNQ